MPVLLSDPPNPSVLRPPRAKRLLRWLLNAATILSLLLCLALVGLWIASYWVEPSGNLRRGQNRYTLRVHDGKITLFAPPAEAGSAATANEATRLAGLIENDELAWYVHHNVEGFFRRDGGRTLIVCAAPQRAGSLLGPNPGYWRTPFTVAEVAGPLLRSMESPNAFAVAHIVLTDHLKTGSNVTISDRPDGACEARIDGLKVILRTREPYVANHRMDTVMYHAAAELPPGQLAFIRDQWHRRLDVSVASVSIVVPVAIALAAPAWFTSRKLIEVRRRRRNRCISCCYDLRATPERCPECGTEVENSGQ